MQCFRLCCFSFILLVYKWHLTLLHFVGSNFKTFLHRIAKIFAVVFAIARSSIKGYSTLNASKHDTWHDMGFETSCIKFPGGRPRVHKCPYPGTENPKKCPGVARGGNGHWWNWLMHYTRVFTGNQNCAKFDCKNTVTIAERLLDLFSSKESKHICQIWNFTAL